MLAFLGRRIVAGLLILWAVFTLTFFAVFMLGKPERVLAGPHASRKTIESVRHHYKLDQPKWKQYTSYLGRLVQGDLGYSFRYNRPVQQLIAQRLPRTMLLAVMAISLEITLGVLVGTIAAARRNTKTDAAVMTSSFIVMSTPTFITGKLFLLGAAYYLGLFPMGGYGVTFLEHVHHGVLPAFTLALLSTAYYARLTRNELVETLQLDFVRTARAKGLSNTAVVVRHALHNALLPVVTSLGLSFSSLFTGAIVTESIFAWPGLGRLAFESINGFDLPVILGCVVLGSFGILLGNLLADLINAYLDPRVRAASLES